MCFLLNFAQKSFRNTFLVILFLIFFYIFIMKKHFFIIVFIFISVIHIQTMGQSSGANIIKVSPLTFMSGRLAAVHYERQLGKQFTFGIGAAPLFWRPLFGSISYPITEFKNGFSIDPEFRWYAKSDKVMDGFFIGLYGSYIKSKWITELSLDDLLKDNYYDTYDVNQSKMTSGIQFGTEKMIGEHFVFDFYTGVGFFKKNTDATNQRTNRIDNETTGGPNLRLGVSIGYRF